MNGGHGSALGAARGDGEADVRAGLTRSARPAATSSVLAPEGYRSPAVTCITAPAGRTGSQIVSAMKAKGFVITPGYGEAKDMMIRIGHMGEHTVEELDVLLEALSGVLAS